MCGGIADIQHLSGLTYPRYQNRFLMRREMSWSITLRDATESERFKASGKFKVGFDKENRDRDATLGTIAIRCTIYLVCVGL